MRIHNNIVFLFLTSVAVAGPQGSSRTQLSAKIAKVCHTYNRKKHDINEAFFTQASTDQSENDGLDDILTPFVTTRS